MAAFRAAARRQRAAKKLRRGKIAERRSLERQQHRTGLRLDCTIELAEVRFSVRLDCTRSRESCNRDDCERSTGILDVELRGYGSATDALEIVRRSSQVEMRRSINHQGFSMLLEHLFSQHIDGTPTISWPRLTTENANARISREA